MDTEIAFVSLPAVSFRKTLTFLCRITSYTSLRRDQEITDPQLEPVIVNIQHVFSETLNKLTHAKVYNV